jgi:hypothetical protein
MVGPIGKAREVLDDTRHMVITTAVIGVVAIVLAAVALFVAVSK